MSPDKSFIQFLKFQTCVHFILVRRHRFFLYLNYYNHSTMASTFKYISYIWNTKQWAHWKIV